MGSSHRNWLANLAAPLAISAAGFAQTVQIDFDQLPTSCNFISTVELTTEYVNRGVTFSGPTVGTGGCVLDQCGNFGVNARSGMQFLAFNTSAMSQSGVPRGPQSMFFEPGASSFSLWVSGGVLAGDFRVDAFREGQSVGSNTVQSLAAAYAELTFEGQLGFDQVTITSLGASTYWVFDDLTVELGPPLNSFCFGDGVHLVCPCGNQSVEGEGCLNSSGAGALLGADGSAELGADTFVLDVQNVPAGHTGLFFQGTMQVNGGAGTLFGDGLRCVSGQVTRIQIVQVDAAGAAATTTAISSHSTISPGDMRYYQFWYRDPIVGPCSQGFNLSNGIEVTWQ